jgi:hypothetical protein
MSTHDGGALAGPGDGEPCCVHVALDADPLCLGMLAPLSIGLGFETYLIGSPGTAQSRTFERLVYRRDGSIDRERHTATDSLRSVGDQIPSPVQAAARRADLLLITASTQAGLAERAGLILAVAAIAKPGAETVFLSSDAVTTSADDALIAGLGAHGVLSPPAIVDRFCTWDQATVGAPPSRTAATHELGALTLPDRDGLLRARLTPADEVRFASSQRFAALSDQKAWMVDGPHLAIALAARRRNRSASVRDFVHHPARIEQLGQMLDAIAAVIRIAHGAEVNATQALDRELVAMRLPNFGHAILRDFKRADLAAFVDRFGECIGRPAVIAAETDGPLDPFRSIGRTLTMMLSDGHHYEDLLEVGPDDVTEDADEAAVDAYRRALSGWYEVDRIEAGAREIRTKLRYQRDELARRGRLG